METRFGKLSVVYSAFMACVLALTLSACGGEQDMQTSGESTLESAGVQIDGAVDQQAAAPKNLGIPTSAPIAGPKPGFFKRINLPSGRHFMLHVPENYDESKQWPLILAFHGWKETSWQIYKYSQLSAAQAITVYPQGEARAWAPAPYAETTGEEDIAYVEDIIDSLRATYTIDDNRIFAAGMSNGGGFAAYLACQLPNVFKSVATVSAAYYEAIHKDCDGAPVGRLDIHGTYDPIVDYYGGRRHGARYVSVNDVLAMDAQRNRCAQGASTERLTDGALYQTWSQCEAPLQHIRIGGGEHVWPGGTADKTNTVTPGFATDKVLDFFAIPGRPDGSVDQ